MKNMSTELKVGFVVILAIAILLYAIIWIKDFKFGSHRYEVTALFPEIGTLRVGDPVNVLGVNKGSVDRIGLQGDKVKLVFSLDNDVELREDASVNIANVGLMGERIVAVNPGKSDKPYDLSLPMNGGYDTGISEVFGMMGNIITEVRSLIGALEGTFGDENQTTGVRSLIVELHKLVNNTNSFYDQNQKPLNDAVKNLSASASKMRTFLDSNEVQLNETATNMAEFSLSVRELTDRLNAMTLKLERGEGTLGKTLADDSLYYNLKSMVNNLDSLITDFKAHPKRYVKVSIF